MTRFGASASRDFLHHIVVAVGLADVVLLVPTGASLRYIVVADSSSFFVQGSLSGRQAVPLFVDQ